MCFFLYGRTEWIDSLKDTEIILEFTKVFIFLAAWYVRSDELLKGQNNGSYVCKNRTCFRADKYSGIIIILK